MACYRCSICNINYPTSMMKCQVCLGKMDYISEPDATPHEDWKRLVDEANGIYKFELPKLKGDRVTMVSNQPWIAGAALESWGYPGAGIGDIICVEGKTSLLYFELSGMTRENIPGTTAQGWWLQRIDWDGAAVDLTPEMFTGGGAEV